MPGALARKCGLYRRSWHPSVRSHDESEVKCLGRSYKLTDFRSFGSLPGRGPYLQALLCPQVLHAVHKAPPLPSLVDRNAGISFLTRLKSSCCSPRLPVHPVNVRPPVEPSAFDNRDHPLVLQLFKDPSDGPRLYPDLGRNLAVGQANKPVLLYVSKKDVPCCLGCNRQ